MARLRQILRHRHPLPGYVERALERIEAGERAAMLHRKPGRSARTS